MSYGRRLLIAALAVLILVCALGLFMLLDRWGVTLTLSGDRIVTVEVGDSYEDAGAQAYLTDRFLFHNRQLSVLTDESVDMSRVGSFTVRYSAGFLWFKASAVRSVNVVDLTPPILVLVGDEQVELMEGDDYVESGWSAYDAVDGDVSGLVTVEGEVNAFASGTYILSYTAVDFSGNETTTRRRVTVKQAEPEVSSAGEEEQEKSFRWGNGIDVKAAEQAGKVIYLTFDDGPSIYTEGLLDVLDAYGVKATFFVVNNVHTELIGEEVARGHSVGIHSASHVYSQIYASTDAFFADLDAMAEVIRERSGVDTDLMRFPGGSSNTVSAYYTEGIMTELVDRVSKAGYFYFDWNVDSEDASSEKDPEKLAQNMIEGIERCNVSLVLQHDTKASCAEATEIVIQWGRENGYTFLPLTEDSFGAHQRVFN